MDPGECESAGEGEVRENEVEERGAQGGYGIERKRADYVEREDGQGVEWIERGERISVTFRWMLEGGDVL